MITLTYGVIAYLTFSQIENISGFGGISGIVPPDIIGTTDAHPHRLYYLSLVIALLLYALIRYLIRTPFGIALQGVRDEPVRMSSLGYSVVAPPHARVRLRRVHGLRSQGCCSCGGTATSTRRRSASAPRSTC